MKERSREAARVARLLQRLADVSDQDVASALGWKREAFNRKVNRALQGVGSLTVDDIEDIASAFDVSSHIFFLPAAEALQWVAEHRPELTLVVDLTVSESTSDLPDDGSAWTHRRVRRPIGPTRLIDLLVPSFSIQKSPADQLVLRP